MVEITNFFKRYWKNSNDLGLARDNLDIPIPSINDKFFKDVLSSLRSDGLNLKNAAKDLAPNMINLEKSDLNCVTRLVDEDFYKIFSEFLKSYNIYEEYEKLEGGIFISFIVKSASPRFMSRFEENYDENQVEKNKDFKNLISSMENSLSLSLNMPFKRYYFNSIFCKNDAEKKFFDRNNLNNAINQLNNTELKNKAQSYFKKFYADVDILLAIMTTIESRINKILQTAENTYSSEYYLFRRAADRFVKSMQDTFKSVYIKTGYLTQISIYLTLFKQLEGQQSKLDSELRDMWLKPRKVFIVCLILAIPLLALLLFKKYLPFSVVYGSPRIHDQQEAFKI